MYKRIRIINGEKKAKILSKGKKKYMENRLKMSQKKNIFEFHI